MKRIYVIGYMGSGKSTIAKKLATQLSWSFQDTDQMVIDQCGLEIPKIFSKYGERIFRGMEAGVLRSTMHNDQVVISTGGGLPCHNENIEWMKTHGMTIYLQLDPQGIYDRLIKERNNRPLIKDKTPKELHAFIQAHLDDRKPCYRQAAITINAAQNIADVISNIQHQLIEQQKLVPLSIS